MIYKVVYFYAGEDIIDYVDDDESAVKEFERIARAQGLEISYIAELDEFCDEIRTVKAY